MGASLFSLACTSEEMVKLKGDAPKGERRLLKGERILFTK